MERSPHSARKLWDQINFKENWRLIECGGRIFCLIGTLNMSKNAGKNYQSDSATFAEIGHWLTALRRFKFARLGQVGWISMQYFIGQRHFVRIKCRVSWQCATSIENCRCLWSDKLKGMYTGLEFSQWFWILLKHIKGDMAETARRIVMMARLAYICRIFWNWMLVARMFFAQEECVVVVCYVCVGVID